jgi:hypothetical protein
MLRLFLLDSFCFDVDSTEAEILLLMFPLRTKSSAILAEHAARALKRRVIFMDFGVCVTQLRVDNLFTIFYGAFITALSVLDFLSAWKSWKVGKIRTSFSHFCLIFVAEEIKL